MFRIWDYILHWLQGNRNPRMSHWVWEHLCDRDQYGLRWEQHHQVRPDHWDQVSHGVQQAVHGPVQGWEGALHRDRLWDKVSGGVWAQMGGRRKWQGKKQINSIAEFIFDQSVGFPEIKW